MAAEVDLFDLVESHAARLLCFRVGGVLRGAAVLMGVIGRHAGLLVLLTVGLWSLLALPAHRLAGAPGLEGLTYAALLCFAPGVVTTVLAAVLSNSSASSLRLVLFLSGMLFRMFVVLGGALAVRVYRPDLTVREFYAWLLVFYLATMAAETFLILKPSRSAAA